MRVPSIRRLCLILAVVLALLPIGEAQGREYFLPKPDARKFAVILGGAAVNETYQTRFRQWVLKLREILLQDYGYAAEHITLLFADGDAGSSTIAGSCRLESILTTMERLRKNVQPADQVTIFFVGHGTSDDQDAKFVIPGPDITGTKFAEMLDEFSEQDLVVVNTTSSSHSFCSRLSAPGRVIVCATRSAAERYDTVFARFLLEALEGHAADRDKNRRVSLLEIFLFTKQKVKTWYTDQNRLPTEHPTLDDNGDGRLQTEPDPARDDGALAQIADIDTLETILLDSLSEGPAAETLRKLTARVRALERSVILLRRQKSEMSDRDYRQQLEILLIDLAQSSRRMRFLRANLQNGYSLERRKGPNS